MASVITTVTNVRAVLGGKIRACNMRLSEGRIQGILPAGEAYGKVIDGHGMLALPGFIDAHTHGAWGISLNTAEAREVRTLRDFYASHGVTTFLPAISADCEENMLRAASAIGEAKSQLGCSQIAGIHLEGPFLAEAWRGKAPKEVLRQPGYSLYRRVQDASGGIVTRVTLSPELPGAAALVRRLVSDGVRVSLGHSGASYEEAMACIQAGATAVTHLFHNTAPMSREEPGLVAAALEQDLFCEILCDGLCVPPPLVRLLVKAKGQHRTVAVTDSVFVTGLGEGLYQLHDKTAALRDGALCYLEEGGWAGSILTADQCLLKLAEVLETSPEQCVPLLTEAPARMLGLGHRKGSLEVGKDADMVFLDKSYRVRLTISQGNVIYDSAAV